MVEQHPLKPFLPADARLLMAGTFPPPRNRWCMDFFYPNFTNDMWRIFGLVFLGDKLALVDGEGKTFRKDKIERLLRENKIALFDSVTAATRLRQNASDKFLEIVQPTDMRRLLDRIPQCRYIAATGEKAAETIAAQFGADPPKNGGHSELSNDLRLYRMPSSSRAYPLAVEKKADAYRRMFRETGILP